MCFVRLSEELGIVYSIQREKKHQKKLKIFLKKIEGTKTKMCKGDSPRNLTTPSYSVAM
eukprot:m.205875 g.205875  ORF g.205875 m.205875 type:complete len:59 (+) comp15791_c0_seq17:1181-1357(+)